MMFILGMVAGMALTLLFAWVMSKREKLPESERRARMFEKQAKRFEKKSFRQYARSNRFRGSVLEEQANDYWRRAETIRKNAMKLDF